MIVRQFNARVETPSLEEQLTGAGFGCCGLPDDPHAEMDACPRCADPEYSDEEIDEMFRLHIERVAGEAECAGMTDPRVA